jgi:hypothetical protein
MYVWMDGWMDGWMDNKDNTINNDKHIEGIRPKIGAESTHKGSATT